MLSYRWGMGRMSAIGVQSGKHILGLSISGFDPTETSPGMQRPRSTAGWTTKNIAGGKSEKLAVPAQGAGAYFWRYHPTIKGRLIITDAH